jgi:uncharacterized damage-inducible protein DinB
MKEYFIQLLDYNKYANELILAAIFEINKPVLPVQLMAHTLAAQQVWYNRCKGLPPTFSVLWPDWEADTLGKISNDNHNAWADLLNSLEPGDFERHIAYKDLRGNAYENKLSDILAHLFNHGTHHRAQAGQHLKAAGLEKLPNTDYIFYIRTK